jgi:hypothetical protein
MIFKRRSELGDMDCNLYSPVRSMKRLDQTKSANFPILSVLAFFCFLCFNGFFSYYFLQYTSFINIKGTNCPVSTLHPAILLFCLINEHGPQRNNKPYLNSLSFQSFLIKCNDICVT